MKFYYSVDKTSMLVQPADGRFYPFPARPHSDFTEEEFEDRPYLRFATYTEAQKVLNREGVRYPDDPIIESKIGETQ